MKTRLFSFVTLCLLSVNVLFAQDARSILDKAYEDYNNIGGIVAKFTLDTKDINANQTFSQDGTAYMKGNKFKIEIPDAISWFDGKTQWTYIKINQEVNITNPTGEELQAISPSILFSIYKQGYDLKYIGEKTIKGRMIQTIEMTAQNKKADLKKITVEINKSTNNFSRIILSDTNGIENTLTITSYTPNSSINDNTFVFNKSEYPDVEIVDLR